MVLVKRRLIWKLLLLIASVFGLFLVYAKTGIPLSKNFTLFFFVGITFFSLLLFLRFQHLPRAGREGKEHFTDLILSGLFSGWMAIVVYIDFMGILFIV